MDLFEINEAFAMVTMLAMRGHDLDHTKVNIHGGACAQGHPIGSTGSRDHRQPHVRTEENRRPTWRCGLCIGGGEATAIGIEML